MKLRPKPLLRGYARIIITCSTGGEMLRMLCFLLLLAIFESSIFLLTFAACADVEMCSMMLLCRLCRLLCSRICRMAASRAA